MPTLTRLLLVFTSLVLGPLVVMADELPEDTNKITSLTVEEAKRVVAQHNAKVKDTYLNLDGLTTLDAATAPTLAEFKGQLLNLNGLTTLDAATATALAEFKGQSMWLYGLERASFGAVRALRNHPKVEINHWYLLRYEIAALVGTVVFVVMAGVVVWYSRRHRDAG
jgi:hypothetical protein